MILIKALYFFLPICEAKRAGKVIKEKIDCLLSWDKCDDELKNELQKEKQSLDTEKPDQLKELIEKEIERKRIIEDKSKSFLTIISLIGIILAMLFNLTKASFSIVNLLVLLFFILLELLYVILSIYTLFYILSEINIVYELPLYGRDGPEELKKTVLLNRYQNILRTNYLNTIYSNIKRFFILLLIVFLVYSYSVIGNNLTAYNSGHTPSPKFSLSAGLRMSAKRYTQLGRYYDDTKEHQKGTHH